MFAVILSANNIKSILYENERKLTFNRRCVTAKYKFRLGRCSKFNFKFCFIDNWISFLVIYYMNGKEK